MNSRSSERATRMVFVLSLAVAAALRLSRLDLAPFCVDQVSVLRMVDRMLDGSYLPVRGPDIGPGLFEWGTLGPLEYYVMAPLVLVAKPLLGAVRGPLAAFVLLGLASFPALYRLGERHLGRGVGALACLLYAVAPNPFYLSRELMDHSFLAPVMPLFFLALCELGAHASVGWAAVACGALAAAMQFHVTTVVFVPVLLAVMIASRVGPLGWIAGVAASTVLYAPYLHAQVSESFPDLRAMLSVARGEGIGIAASRAGGQVLRLLALVLSGTAQTPQVEMPLVVRRLGTSFAAAVAAGLAIALTRAIRGPGSGAGQVERASSARWPFAIVVAWLALPIAFLATQRTELYARHLALVLPAPQILAALLVVSLTSWGAARARTRAKPAATSLVPVLAVALLASWIGAALWTIWRYQQLVERSSLIAGKPPLGVEEAIARGLLARGARAASFDRVGLAGGGQELDALHYLLERSTITGPPPAVAEDVAFLVVAPTDVIDDPLLRFLQSLGWNGGVALLEHRASLDAKTLVVTRNGALAATAGLGAYGTAEPGPVEMRATVRKRSGDRIVLVVDTHVCLERLVVDDVVSMQRSCDRAQALPWAVRSTLELPAELEPGEHSVVIHGFNPVRRLFLTVFDLTVPAAGIRFEPRAHALQVVELR